MFTIKELIDIAIRIEQNGATAYQQAKAKTTRPAFKELMQWLVDQELEHAQWFRDLGARLPEETQTSAVQEIDPAFIENLMGGQSFSLDDVDFAALEQFQDVFNAAIELENDTILFYEMLLPFIDNPLTAEQLNLIIKEEKGHVRRLQEMLADETALTRC